MTELKTRKFVRMMAFAAIVLVAASLLLQLILKAVNVSASIVNAFRIVGECIAYLVVCVTAFGFVRNKRSPVWAITYAICVTIIVVLLILR